MTLNEVLNRHKIFTKILLKEGEKELPKELKVKIMRIRMAYTKVKKLFDSEVKEFTEELIPYELKNLIQKSEKTEEEQIQIKELSNKVNLEYQEFLTQKYKEEVNMIDDSLTAEEYFDILDINAGNNVEINGNTIPAADFLEIIYDLFVKE